LRNFSLAEFSAFRPDRLIRSLIRLFGGSFAKRVVVLILVMLAIVYSANIVFIGKLWQSTEKGIQHERRDEATGLGEHASHALGDVDHMLGMIQTELGPSPDFKHPTPAFRQNLLRHQQSRPQLLDFGIADAEGRQIYDSRAWPGAGRNLSDRPFFAEQKRAHGAAPYIDAPDILKDRPPAIILSRPILDPAGKFLGIVFADIDPGYFAAYYSSPDIGLSGAAALIRLDGTILAFGSDDPYAENLMGRPLSDFYDYHSSLTSLTLPVSGLPLEIVVATPPAMQRASFRTYLDVDFLTAMVLNICAILMGRALIREARARERAEKRLTEAIGVMPSGFALWDENDRLVLANSHYRKFFQDSRAEVRPLAEFESLARILAVQRGIPPEAVEAWVEENSARHRHANAETVEKLGDRWHLLRERRTDEGGVVSIFVDVTDLRDREEALQVAIHAEREARRKVETASIARNEFLANMSHELRTPLNSIIGFSEIIAQESFGPGSPRYVEYASLVEQSGRHLLATINDILDLVKIQAGRLELKIEPVDIRTPVNAAIGHQAAQIETKGLTVTTEIGTPEFNPPEINPPGTNRGQTLPIVLADPLRLRQILLNLLSNAVKFTPSGGTIRITARFGPHQAFIEVIDSGIGMAPEDIPKALEPFSQIDGSIVRSHEGAGLGLSLSKTLIELQGGKIEIKSAPNLGTTVRFTLPMVETLPV